LKYLLDTNTCIAILKGSPASVVDRFLSIPSRDIAFCSIVKEELLHGAQKSTQAARNLAMLGEFFSPYTSFKLDDQAAARTAVLRIELDRAGSPIGPSDTLIAGIALHRGLTVVSHDGDFSRVPGLRVEDWQS
jgi:tRNA(fMet)-specific endonuclease VapC